MCNLCKALNYKTDFMMLLLRVNCEFFRNVYIGAYNFCVQTWVKQLMCLRTLAVKKRIIVTVIE